MKVSALQKFILRECLAGQDGGMSKQAMTHFYLDKNVKPKNVINDISKSIDRLILRDLAIGFGKKTSHKWLISRVQLTAAGKKYARRLFGKQQKLPFKLKSHS